MLNPVRSVSQVGQAPLLLESRCPVYWSRQLVDLGDARFRHNFVELLVKLFETTLINFSVGEHLLVSLLHCHRFNLLNLKLNLKLSRV